MRRFLLLMVIFGAGILVSSPLLSQTQSEQVPFWEVICDDPNNRETCRMTMKLFVNKNVNGVQQSIGKLLGLWVRYIPDKKTGIRAPYMNIQTPLGVDLRPGAVMKIDKGKELNARYLRCTANGCDISVKLEPEVVSAMKAGNNFFVGFRAWGGGDTTAVSASLKGFTKAFNSLK